MGVLHGLDKDGQLLTAERREYLRRQSDRKYVPIKHRNQPSTTTTCKPSFDNVIQNGGNFEPALHDYRKQSNDRSDEDMKFKMFLQMMSDYESEFNRVRMRKEKKTTMPAVNKPLEWIKY
jgi:hypothetical protein